MSASLKASHCNALRGPSVFAPSLWTGEFYWGVSKQRDGLVFGHPESGSSVTASSEK